MGAPTSGKRPNLLILAIDTLRADHLSTYGYPRLTSPHIDRLASQGVQFDWCFAPNVPTTPAYCAMLTGMDVMSTRMVALQPNEPLPAHLQTLPNLLRPLGYASACIGFSGPDQEARYRGFDTYENYRQWMSWEERPGDKAHQMNLKAIPHLEKWARDEQPFLLFLRHMDPHSPYLPPAPFDRMFYSGEDECDPRHLESPETMKQVFDFAPFADFFRSWMPPGITDGKYVIAQYDGAIAYMDACLARMFTRLEELGIADNTIVILTGDHGESLLEHQIWFDHHGLYETNIHVPLIIKAPGRLPAGVRIPGNVAHQDMLPTILDLLGEHELAASLDMDGKSVVPLVHGERRDNHDEMYLTECTWMRKRGWRTHEWKLIQAMEPDFHGFPPIELYHLPSDPDEKLNVADREPAVVAFLIERMERWVAKRCSETGATDPILQYKMGLDRRIGSIGQARDLQAKSSTAAVTEKKATGGSASTPTRKRAPRARTATE